MLKTQACEHAEANIIPPRNKWKAQVRIEGDVVTKSFKHNPLIQRWIGRWLLTREQRALQRLDSTQGIPHVIDRPGPYSLRTSKIDGIPLRNCYEQGISEAALQNLKELFNVIHRRGVGHGDAHHRNILIDGDRVGLIDFSTAFVTRDAHNSGRIFQWYLALDQRALYKVEHSFFGRGSSPEMFLLYRLVKYRKLSASPRGTNV